MRVRYETDHTLQRQIQYKQQQLLNYTLTLARTAHSLSQSLADNVVC